MPVPPVRPGWRNLVQIIQIFLCTYDDIVTTRIMVALARRFGHLEHGLENGWRRNCTKIPTHE